MQDYVKNLIPPWDLFYFGHYYLLFTVDSRGGTVRRCHGSVCTSVRGSRFDAISVQHEKKKSTMLGFFSFILNRQ